MNAGTKTFGKPGAGRRKARAEAEIPASLSAGAQETNVGYNLIRTYDLYVRYLKTRTRSRMMDISLTQWLTLTFIRFNPLQRQRALSAAVGIDPSTMSPIIDTLERKGWVRREGDKRNRSAYGIALTESGAETYDLIAAEMEIFEKMIAGKNGEAARKSVAAALKSVQEALTSEETEI